MTDVVDPQTKNRSVTLLGRLGLVAQGVLYAGVGVLAVAVARGDRGAHPSQRGAIAALARQPFGRVLLLVLAAGLASHALWRVVLTIRGEPGDDEDAKSVAKRLASAGRAVIYAGFTVVALEFVAGAKHSDQGSSTQQKSTAGVLSWPGGRVLVMVAGAVVIGAGVWNIRKGVTRSFTKKLRLEEVEEGHARIIESSGIIGYIARGLAFALVGWFLLSAGWDHNPGETRTLDQALRDVPHHTYGTFLLLLLAAGLVAFGVFRMVDGVLRRPIEVSHA